MVALTKTPTPPPDRLRPINLTALSFAVGFSGGFPHLEDIRHEYEGFSYRDLKRSLCAPYGNECPHEPTRVESFSWLTFA